MGSESIVPGGVFADRFEIVKLLGEGAFGSVYEAKMRPMMRRVALKVLHPEVVGHPQLAARFVREARILGELEHPNVVSVIDVGLVDGSPFLAMEILDGETLAGRIRQGPIPLQEALAIFFPICAAVQAIHDRRIVHRDLKPDNIMLARQATGHVVPPIRNATRQENSRVYQIPRSTQLPAPLTPVMPPGSPREAPRWLTAPPPKAAHRVDRQTSR